MPNDRRPIRLHRGWRLLQQFACALLAICCVSGLAAIPALAQLLDEEILSREILQAFTLQDS